MSILSSALAGAASIFGGFKASKAMKNVKNNLLGQGRDTENWFNRNYYADPTQRASAVRALSLNEQSIRNRNNQAAAAQAVMGGTEESVAATKAANAQSMADTAAQIAIAGEQRKDNIEQQYMTRKDNINNQLNNLQMQKAQAITEATKGAADAMGKLSTFGI